MNYEAIGRRYPLPQEAFKKFARNTQPSLDYSRLNAEILVGETREDLSTTITGAFSTVLRYKGIEGAVSSFDVQNETDMILLQLQGARSSVSWRVATAFRWDDFLIHDAIENALTPESGVQRLGMPNPLQIQGIESARSEEAINRYKAFIVIASLTWSQTDQLYVRDIT